LLLCEKAAAHFEDSLLNINEQADDWNHEVTESILQAANVSKMAEQGGPQSVQDSAEAFAINVEGFSTQVDLGEDEADSNPK